MQVSRFYKNNHFICERNVVVYTVAVVSSYCRQHSYAKMIITFMLLEKKKVLSGRRSFSHRVKYKEFATRSVCFGLLNTCISGVLECRIRSKFVSVLRESHNRVVYAHPKYYFINSYLN